MGPVQLPPDSTLLQDIDDLVSSILTAARKPSQTTILAVVTQVIAFIVAFGIIGPTEQGTLIAIITGAVNVAVLIAHSVKQFAAHKAAAAITQARLDLVDAATLPEGALRRARMGSRV